MSLYGPGGWSEFIKQPAQSGEEIPVEQPNPREVREAWTPPTGRWGKQYAEQGREAMEARLARDYQRWLDRPQDPTQSVLPQGTFDEAGQLPTAAPAQPVTPITQLVGGTKKFDPHRLSTALRQTTPATPTGAVTAPTEGEGG